MTDTPQHVIGATKMSKSDKNRSKFSRFCRSCMRFSFWMPAFVWVLGFYWSFATYVVDLRTPFFMFGNYVVSWLDLLYLLAFMSAANEIQKVIKPGDDNTNEALAMTAILVIYIILFTLGAVGQEFFKIFATSEFLMLIFFSLVQVVLAFRINSATLKRTFASSDDGNGYD